MATHDVHVEFDIANSRKYHRAIVQTIAVILVVGVAVASAGFLLTGDAPTKFCMHISGVDAVTTGIVDLRTHTSCSVMLFVLVGISGAALALVLFVVPHLLRKTLEAQRCRITTTQIVCESGWINHTVQTIPLDRIQDLSVKQGFLQRHFGLHSIEIQTAGSPSPFPELVLHAPRNALAVRSAIMARRDVLVLHSTAIQDSSRGEGRSQLAVAAPANVLARTSIDDGDDQQQHAAIVDALTELNRTAQRIEVLLVAAAEVAAKQALP